MSKLLGQRPSQIVQISESSGGAWVAYQFDSAILAVGIAIENALNEFNKDGSKVYDIETIMQPDFKLPRPLTKEEKERKTIRYLRNWIGKGIKWVKAKE